MVVDFLEVLGASPTPLSPVQMFWVWKAFELSRTEKVLWADVEFGRHPCGIVVTEHGVHFRSVVLPGDGHFGPCSMEMEEAFREISTDEFHAYWNKYRTGKSVCSFVHWVAFRTEEYIGDCFYTNEARLVGHDHAMLFIEACKKTV